jgi:hypothetical protein
LSNSSSPFQKQNKIPADRSSRSFERSSSSNQRTRASQPSRGRQTQNSLRAGQSPGLDNPGRDRSHNSSQKQPQNISNLSVSSISQFPFDSTISISNMSQQNPTGPIAGSSTAPGTALGAGNQNTQNSSANQSQGMQNYSRQRMPKPGEKNAPSFDPEKPEELGRFFDRMEDWFADEGITDDDDKKRRIVKYLDADSEIQWKALPKFLSGTFDEFKAEAMSSYPAAEEVMKGSVAALKRKIKRIGPIATDERDDLLSLIRIMTAEVMKLKKIAPPIHTNRELVDLFLSRLMPEFASRVASKLSVHRLIDTVQQNNAQAQRNPEDMYDIEDVMKIARHTSLEQANPFGKFLMGSQNNQAASSVKLEEAVARLTDSIQIQTQYNKQMDQRLASLQNVMARERSTQNQGFGQSNQPTYNRSQMQGNSASYSNNNSTGQCFYCEESGHRMPDCPSVLTHLDLGWIRKVDGYLRMPDGSKLPREATRTTKEVVECRNRKTPGVLKLPDKSSLYQGSSNTVSLIQTHPGQSRDEDDVKVLLELVQRMGVDQVKGLLSTRVQAPSEEEEWEQNFD